MTAPIQIDKDTAYVSSVTNIIIFYFATFDDFVNNNDSIHGRKSIQGFIHCLLGPSVTDARSDEL